MVLPLGRVMGAITPSGTPYSPRSSIGKGRGFPSLSTPYSPVGSSPADSSVPDPSPSGKGRGFPSLSTPYSPVGSSPADSSVPDPSPSGSSSGAEAPPPAFWAPQSAQTVAFSLFWAPHSVHTQQWGQMTIPSGISPPQNSQLSPAARAVRAQPRQRDRAHTRQRARVRIFPILPFIPTALPSSRPPLRQTFPGPAPPGSGGRPGGPVCGRDGIFR